MNHLRPGRIYPTAAMLAGVLFAMMLIVQTGVRSAAAQASDEARRACTPEAFRLCNQYVPDAGQVAACLRRNRSAVNAECRRFLGGGEARRPVHRRHYNR
jgi:hypothetical protein